MAYVDRRMEMRAVKAKYDLPPDEIIRDYGERGGSFYTFYPMNGQWQDGVDGTSFRNVMTDFLNRQPEAPLTLYLHFPFCPKQCLFCHCFTVISRDGDAYTRFVDYLIREIDMLRTLFLRAGVRPNVKDIHFGGGSPSVIPRRDFDRLIQALSDLCDFSAVDDCAIEIDPRNEMSVEKLLYYRSKGVDRISIGIQDFNADIMKTIARVNPYEMVASLLTKDVRNAFKSINFDLIYGLPGQSIEDFRETLEKVVDLSPDRLAIYPLGLRPELYRHQGTLNERLPDATKLTEMQVLHKNFLLERGYEEIGIDHFAKPGEALHTARENGTLSRNAMGYTCTAPTNIIGIGPSSLYEIDGHYFQNRYTLESYFQAVDEEQNPVFRGHLATDDDRLRRRVIFDIILDREIDKHQVGLAFGINFDDYFKDELKSLEAFENDGLLKMTDARISLTRMGELYQRHVCAVFDAYTRAMGYSHSQQNPDSRKAVQDNRKILTQLSD